MARSCIGIWTSFLVLFRVTTAYDLDNTSKKSSYEEQQGTRLSSTLYERCLQMDTGACLGYILFNTAAGFIQNTTIMQLDNKTESGTGRQVDEDKVDSILLQKFLEFLGTISVWSPSDTPDAARRNLGFRKKMMFPLLIGVVLKFGSLIPVALGKLALIGSMALIASKLSLLLIGAMGLKKLFSGSDGGLYQQGHQHHDDQYVYYGGGGQHAHQRMTYRVRGRKIEQEDWPQSVGAESRGFVTDRNERVFGNLKTVEESSGQGNWAPFPEPESRDKVERVSRFMYTTQDENKSSAQSDLRESESLNSTDESPDTRFTNSEAEPEDTENLSKDRRQLLFGDIKRERNLTQHTLNSNALRDNRSVTAHEAIYTRDSADRDVISHAMIDRNDQRSEQNIEGGHGEFKNQTNQEKGTQNKVTRLVKRHYTEDIEGQNHYRDYSAGRRRLDDVEREHVDAWVIRRKINRA